MNIEDILNNIENINGARTRSRQGLKRSLPQIFDKEIHLDFFDKKNCSDLLRGRHFGKKSLLRILESAEELGFNITYERRLPLTRRDRLLKRIKTKEKIISKLNNEILFLKKELLEK